MQPSAGADTGRCADRRCGTGGPGTIPGRGLSKPPPGGPSRLSRFIPHRTRTHQTAEAGTPAHALRCAPASRSAPSVFAPVRRDDRRAREPLSPNRRARTSAATTRRPRPRLAHPTAPQPRALRSHPPDQQPPPSGGNRVSPREVAIRHLRNRLGTADLEPLRHKPPPASIPSTHRPPSGGPRGMHHRHPPRARHLPHSGI